MKRESVVSLTAAAFLIGVAVPPVWAAESGYVKVAGGSASCTLVKASANPTNERAGSLTRNFEGCSSSNPVKNMAAGYLGTQPILMRNGQVCGFENARYTTSTDYDISRSQPNNSCSAHGTFQGHGWGYRWIASESEYRGGLAISPYANW